MAVRHDPTFWLLARAGGLAAYVLLTSSVLAGLTLKSRSYGRLRPAQVVELHLALALAGLGALALHGAALVADSTVHVSLPGLLVPGLVAYRTGAVAVGVVAAWAFVVVAASFWVRRRIGFRAWRRIHWLTYGLFAAATYHGLAAGTDTAQPWARVLYPVAIGAVAAATAWRALVRPSTTRIPKGEPA
jgi:sulfoxide reductase heme-binding subunit YedZ